MYFLERIHVTLREITFRKKEAINNPAVLLEYLHAQSGKGARLFSPVVRIGTPLLPHPQATVPPPLWFRGGGIHSLAGGVGPNSDEGIDTVGGTLGTSIYLLCAFMYRYDFSQEILLYCVCIRLRYLHNMFLLFI
jgi:hypothetical protein